MEWYERRNLKPLCILYLLRYEVKNGLYIRWGVRSQFWVNCVSGGFTLPLFFEKFGLAQFLVYVIVSCLKFNCIWCLLCNVILYGLEIIDWSLVGSVSRREPDNYSQYLNWKIVFSGFFIFTKMKFGKSFVFIELFKWKKRNRFTDKVFIQNILWRCKLIRHAGALFQMNIWTRKILHHKLWYDTYAAQKIAM